MRKFMPTTYKTFLIGSIALAGLPPLAGFWSKDEILVGTGGWGFFQGDEIKANGAYTLMLIMGVAAAALTAAYMTRCVYLTFFGEYRGHGTPHESGPRITIPLWILAGMATVVGFLNLPSPIADFLPIPAHKFQDWVEPAGTAYFPPVGHATFSWGLAIISTLVVLLGVGIAYNYYFVKVERLGGKSTELPDGITSRNKLAKAGHTMLVNKYYLDHLYTNVIAGGTKGPLARAVNVFNKRVLDGFVDGVGKSAVRTGDFVYNQIDQKVVDGVVNGSGIGAGFTGQFLRRMQTGKVQQYAALMFAGAALLAGMFVVFI